MRPNPCFQRSSAKLSSTILSSENTFRRNNEGSREHSDTYHANFVQVSSFFVSVPTKPLNLSSHGITSTTIELSWAEPDYANGIISGYRIYYMHSNYTDVQMYRTDEYDGPIIEFVLKELGEYSFVEEN